MVARRTDALPTVDGSRRIGGAIDPVALQPGDLMACWSGDAIGRAITLGTMQPWAPRGLRLGPSHVAIVCRHRGQPLWVESTTLCDTPCAITGRPMVGVQTHLPEDRLPSYAAGRVVRYRLTPINRLSDAESSLLTHILLHHFLGRASPYDLSGAVLSGLRCGRIVRAVLGADLGEVFCSELAAAVLMRLGRLNRADPAGYSPARLLRRLVRTGVYAPVAG